MFTKVVSVGLILVLAAAAYLVFSFGIWLFQKTQEPTVQVETPGQVEPEQVAVSGGALGETPQVAVTTTRIKIDDSITKQSVTDATNLTREAVGLMPLKDHLYLAWVAQSRAEVLASLEHFSHTLPDGTYSWDSIDTKVYDYSFMGENLARSFTSLKAMQEKWLNSPTHEANITEPDFREIGVGIAKDAEGELYVVVLFGRSY